MAQNIMSTRASFARWWKRHTHHLRRRGDRVRCREYAAGAEEPRVRKDTEQTQHWDGRVECWLSVRLR